MPLQIRRGPTADRLANTPLAGELVYDTTTGSVYVGNGTTACPYTHLTLPTSLRGKLCFVVGGDLVAKCVGRVWRYLC